MSAGSTGDPGLAAERTTLAWQRTGLSSLAVAALASHSFQHRPALAVPVAALLTGLGILAHRTGRDPGPTPPGRLRLVSLGVTAAAVAGLAAILIG